MTWVEPWEGEVGLKGPTDLPPELPVPPPPPKRSQFGLRHIMILSAVVAVVIAAIAQFLRSGRADDLLLAVLTTALTIVGSGFFLTRWQARWSGLGWIVVVVGLTVFSIVLTGWLTLLIMPIVIGGLVFVVLRRRAVEQDSLLWVLALAAERNRPLGPAVSALAQQTSGVYRLRALRLAECLNYGMPLPDSLDFVRTSTTATAKVMVRVGHDSGSLAKALQDAAQSRSARPAGWQNFGAKVGYFFMVLAVLQVVTGMLLYFVTPKFEAIFKDFGIGLPSMTILVLTLSHWLTKFYVLPVLIMVQGLFVLYTAFAFAGYGSLKVPFIDRIFLRRHTVLILRCLAMIVGGDRPIGVGLQILARWYPTSWVRQRLAGAYLAATQGLDWIEALSRFGLITRSDAALLESSRRVGNLTWALRELAEGSARKLGHIMQIVNQVLMSFLFIGVCGLVGVFAVSYFYPLVILIERLS